MKNLLILSLMILSLSANAQDKETTYKNALIDHNKKVIASFYDALERKDYSQLNGIIDFYGKAVYANQSKNVQDTIQGREAIGTQFRSELGAFAKVKYTTKIYESEDPSLVSVKVKGLLTSADGVKTQSNYMATFKLKNGKIVEYVEYDNLSQSGRS
ncbi:MAG TPA: ketosteroid isomerase family protein [Cytophagales bacterium]|nr:ketosteroid isomerase family protein [Cytophagales bacterium]